MAKTGDTVRYLNSVGGGVIRRIEGNVAYVDEDGFETPVLLKECVVVATATPGEPATTQKTTVPTSTSTTPTAGKSEKTKGGQETFVVEETEGGDKPNIVLAYEAADLKRLSTTNFDTYLVNDSNYYLYFNYATKSNDQHGWTSRYDGIVEPGIQIFLGELQRNELPEIDRVAVQYIAFKRGKEFDLNTPVLVEQRLDTTKFCRLHCFRHNTYFDQPVIALDIVVDGKPCKAQDVDTEELVRSMNEKARHDRKPIKKANTGAKSNKKSNEPLVIDLHIAELVDNTNGLSNADMLNLQIDTFRKIMDQNIKNHGKKIIFIHGKGEGVLRQALLKELNYRYKGCGVQDASFREYGFGATQVTIR